MTTTTSTTRSQTQTTITAAMLDPLPLPVQRYMRFTGVVGKPWIDTVQIRYAGKMRTAQDKGWLPMQVEQCYTTTPPSFLWKVRFKMAGVPLLFGRDIYRDGHAHMLGKLLGLFTVIDGAGEPVDQGTMVRFLQEMSWFPIAYLGENITWQAVDDHCADVTLTAYGKSVTGRMYFDGAGRPLSFIAQRYGDFEGGPVLRTWATPMTDYGPLAGLNLPLSGMGVWQLPEGDFPYINIRLTHVAYNVAIPQY